MITKSLFSVLLLVVAFAGSALAQQPPTGPRPTPTPAATTPTTAAAPAQANVALPMSKMAIIYTDAFLDPKAGIAKFNNLLTKLNGEFQKLKDEITAMQNRAQALESEINKLRDAPPERRSINQRCRARSINSNSSRKIFNGKRKTLRPLTTSAATNCSSHCKSRSARRSKRLPKLAASTWSSTAPRCRSLRGREHRHHARVHRRIQQQESGDRGHHHHAPSKVRVFCSRMHGYRWKQSSILWQFKTPAASLSVFAGRSHRRARAKNTNSRH